MALKVSFSLDWERALTWILFALAFTPLVTTSLTLFPFVFPKTVFIRVLVTVFWALLALLFVRSKLRKSEMPVRLRFEAFREPLVISLFLFAGASLVSTLLGVDPYHSFFGTVERGEGLIQLLYLLLFLAAALLVFRGKDWIAFLKLTVLTGAVVAADAIRAFSEFGIRPNGSFIGNPTFIAAYLLFVFFAVFVVLGSKPSRFFKYASYTAGLLGIAAFAVSNTRGAFAGLLAGLVAVAAYFAARGGENTVSLFSEKIRVKTLGVIFLIVFFTLAAVFILTIENPFWQRVPGLDRLTEVSLEDSTVQSRLLSIGTSLDAVNPSKNSALKFLVGWGPDNYNVAYNTHFNPAVQRYEGLWFDRAHNKLLDVLVMTGIVGLALYLLVWYFTLRFVFRKQKEGAGEGGASMLHAAVLFFATAYFVQNLFVFDQVTNHIPLFFFFGFVAYLSSRAKQEGAVDRERWNAAFGKAVPVLAALLLFSLVAYVAIPFYQATKFVTGLREGSAEKLFGEIDAITTPYTYAQPEIRFRLLQAAARLVEIPEARPFVDASLRLEEEAMRQQPLEPRFYQTVGFVYDAIARINSEPELYLRAEENLRRAMELAPGKQEIMFLLAQNLVSQGKLEEAGDVARRMLAAEPLAVQGQFFYATIMGPRDWDGAYETEKIFRELFALRMVVPADSQRLTFIRNAYNSYLKYYFERQDEEGFLNVMRRALAIETILAEAGEAQLGEGLIEEISSSRVEALEAGIRAFESRGWDAIRLQ